MAASANTGKAGFWRGFLLGLLTAAAGLLALALAYPLVPAAPPEIDPGAASGPAAPAAPALGVAPETASEPSSLGPVAPGPLLEAPDAQTTPPSLAPVASPSASGSPSLVPVAPPAD